MADNVIALKRPTGDDMPAALRAIAEDIESGEYDFPPSMAVLVFADESATAQGGELLMGVHGLGARCHSQIVVQGVLHQALADMSA